MSSPIINPGAYLRTTRKFPQDSVQSLTVEINKAYLDIASAVNNRIVGLFATAITVTGETWFVEGQPNKQQTLRQIFQISDALLIIDHGIDFGIGFENISGFTRIYGTFFDGTFWYPLPHVDVVAAANQIGIKVSPTQIIITKGGGAPAIINGFIVIEWLSFV